MFECGDQLMETTTRVLKPGEGSQWEGQSSIRWRVAWCGSVFERVRRLDEGIDSTTHTDKWNHCRHMANGHDQWVTKAEGVF